MPSWNHDGTQDPKPPPLMADPLSGLVTGNRYDAEAVRVRVVEPAAPDIEAVRSAMESVLDENSELRVDLPDLFGDTRTSELPVQPPPPAAEAPAAVAPPPAAPPPTPPVGIPVVPPATVALPPELPAARRARRMQISRRYSPGFAAVGLLLLVMAVLVIVMLASLIDAISSLFS